MATRFDIDFSSTRDTIRHSNPLLYTLAILAYYTTFPFRAARWRLLLTNAEVEKEAPLPSVWAASRLILLGWMVSAVTWFRMGDAFRGYAYTRESGGSLPRTLGTILAERVLDVATICAFLFAAFLLLYVDEAFQPSRTFLFVAVSLLMLAGLSLLALHLLRTRAAQLLPERIHRMYQSFQEGAMASFRRLPLVVLFGLLAWLSEVARLYFVVQSTGLHVGIGLIMFVTIANALLTAVPLTPGGLGIVETGIVGLLVLALPREDAISVALLDRSITYLSLILFGVVALVLHRRALAKGSKASSVSVSDMDEQRKAT